MVRHAPDGPARCRDSALGRRQVGVDLDLDQHPRVGQRGDDDRRVDRADLGEDLAMRAGEAVEARLVGEEDARAQDVLERRADALEGGLDVRERLADLRVGVPHARDRAVGHGRGRARHHDEVAGADHAAVADDVLPRPAGGVALDRRHQWRKCRRPVTTIAAPAWSAAPTTSASRTEPPGWTIAVTPASIASCGPSGNGKNASDAMTAPVRSVRAFSIAIRTASTRLIWPAPTPSVAPSRASTIAFERTWAHTRQANSRSSHSRSVGARALTTSMLSRSASSRSRSCTSSPP